MYSDADIEMAKADRLADRLARIVAMSAPPTGCPIHGNVNCGDCIDAGMPTGPTGPLTDKQVARYVAEAGEALLSGAESTVETVIALLEDDGVGCTQHQFDDIAWRASGVWMRGMADRYGHGAL